MNARPLLSALLLHGALVAACSEVHSSPQAGDTNTSWLRRCEEQSDCSGEASCLSNLCTLACSAASVNSCDRVSQAASCNLETRSCDVSCGAEQDCLPLGADYRCEAGSCRPQPTLGLSAEQLQINSSQADLELGTMVRNTKTVWLGDHFRVTMTLDKGYSPPGGGAWRSWSSAFAVADVFSDGHIEHQFLTNDTYLTDAYFALGEDGSVARTDAESDAVPIDATDPFGISQAKRCKRTFYDPDLSVLSTQTIGCEDELGPLTSDANGDWLMWQNRQNGGANESLLGRYRPGEQRWLEELRPISTHAVVAFSIQVHDDRLWIFDDMNDPHGVCWLTSLPFGVPITDSLASEPWRSLDLSSLRLTSMPSTSPSLLYADGWLVPSTERWLKEADGTGSRRVLAVPVDNAAEAPEPIAFDLEAKGRTSFYDMRPAPGRDLLVVCYAEETVFNRQHFVLKLASFDTQGASLGAPVELASSDWSLEECRLTWSGSSFLATWAEGNQDEETIAQARFVRVH